MKKFEINRVYKVESICNSDCVWEFKVIERTAQTITFIHDGETKKCRINKKISEYRDAETVYPFGNYSMCPVLSAEKVG